MKKEKLIIFTTRNFDREDSYKLFSLKKNKEHELNEIEKSSLLKHFNKNTNLSEGVDKQKEILLGKINEDSILDEINSYIKDIALSNIYDALIEDISNDKKNERTKLLIDFINDRLFKEKGQYILPSKTLDEAINELNSSNKNQPDFLELRNAIYQRKGQNIYGYRCLELWNDFFDKTGRENFITSLVKDVIKIHCQQNNDANDCINHFFDHYEIVLILHGEDINYPKGQYKEDENNTILLKLNSGLKPYDNSIKTYVYQHTTNIFVNILNNYGETNKSAKEISKYLKNHFTNRAKFEKIEKEILKGDLTKLLEENHTKLEELQIVLKKFDNEKIY